MSDRVVALEATEYFFFTSRDPTNDNQAATAASLAVEVYEDNGTTQITGADTPSADFDSITGLNMIAIAATTANGFEAGKRYTGVVSAGTVASGAVSLVGEVVFQFRVETAAEAAIRQYNEKVYLEHEVSTTTGNTTSRVNLTDFLDAQTSDDDQVGKIITICDVTNDQVVDALIVSVQSARLFNVVNALDGSVLDFTVAAGDMIWMQPVTGSVVAWNGVALATTNPLPNAAPDAAGGLPISDAGALDLDTLLGYLTASVATATALATAQSDLDKLTGSDGATLATAQGNYAPAKAGDQMDLVDSPNATGAAALLATAADVGGIDVSELNAIVDDLINGGRLDLLIDAIKAVTDNLPNSGALSDLAAILTDTGTTLPGLIGTPSDLGGGATLADNNADMAGATFATATDSQEAIRNRGDTAWTTGAGGSAPTVEEIRAEIDSNSTQLAAILTDTGTTLDGKLDAIQAVTDSLPDSGALTTLLSNVAAILTDTGTTLDGKMDSVLALVAASAIRTAVGMSSANLDTQIAALPTAAENRTEMDSNSTQLAALVTQRSVPAKNSAFTFSFKMVDATDFATPETGLTVTATVSKDGAAFGAAAGTVTEIASGLYEMAATAADMNANVSLFRFTATGAAASEVEVITDGGV